MTIAHISDTHLGYSAYSRSASSGENQREWDVCDTFRKVLMDILARDPDVIVHSGDLFDRVRPSNFSVIRGFRLIQEIQRKRKGKPFVIIGGNHDTPNNSEVHTILGLLATIEGVIVEAGRARAVELDDLEVLCIPHKALRAAENVSLSPSLGKKHAILVMHGMADQVAKEVNAEGFAFEVNDARAEQWTYVALGDWHIHRAFGPNICYAGSTDFTSTNIWEESHRPKGWVWFDTEVGQLAFVPGETRKVLDLPPIDASNLTGQELGEKMVANVSWNQEDMPIVRQRVLSVHLETRRALPIAVSRSIEAKCLYYRLQMTAPASVTPTLGGPTSEHVSLESSWQRHIDASPMAAAIDKAALKRLGLELLQEVGEVEAAPVEA